MDQYGFPDDLFDECPSEIPKYFMHSPIPNTAERPVTPRSPEQYFLDYSDAMQQEYLTTFENFFNEISTQTCDQEIHNDDKEVLLQENKSVEERPVNIKPQELIERETNVENKVESDVKILPRQRLRRVRDFGATVNFDDPSKSEGFGSHTKFFWISRLMSDKPLETKNVGTQKSLVSESPVVRSNQVLNNNIVHSKFNQEFTKMTDKIYIEPSPTFSEYSHAPSSSSSFETSPESTKVMTTLPQTSKFKERRAHASDLFILNNRPKISEAMKQICTNIKNKLPKKKNPKINGTSGVKNGQVKKNYSKSTGFKKAKI